MSQLTNHVNINKVRKIISLNENLKKAQLYLKQKMSEKRVEKCLHQLLSYPIVPMQKLNSKNITSQERSSYVENDSSDQKVLDSICSVKKITSENGVDFFHQQIEDSKTEENHETENKSDKIVLYDDKDDNNITVSNKRKRHGNQRPCFFCISSDISSSNYNNLKFCRLLENKNNEVSSSSDFSRTQYEKNNPNHLCESLEKSKHKRNENIPKNKRSLKQKRKSKTRKFVGKFIKNSFRKRLNSVNLKKLKRKTYIIELEEKIKKLQEELGSVTKDKNSKISIDEDVSNVSVVPDYQILNDLDVDTLIHQDDNELMELLADCYRSVEEINHSYTTVRSPDSGIANTSTSDTEDVNILQQLSQTTTADSSYTSITELDVKNKNMQTSLLASNDDTINVENSSEFFNNPNPIFSTSLTESTPLKCSPIDSSNVSIASVSIPMLNGETSALSEPVLTTRVLPLSNESSTPVLTSGPMASFSIPLSDGSEFSQSPLLYGVMPTNLTPPMTSTPTNFMPVSIMEPRLDSCNLISPLSSIVDTTLPISPINPFVFLPTNLVYFSPIMTYFD